MFRSSLLSGSLNPYSFYHQRLFSGQARPNSQPMGPAASHILSLFGTTFTRLQPSERSQVPSQSRPVLAPPVTLPKLDKVKDSLMGGYANGLVALAAEGMVFKRPWLNDVSGGADTQRVVLLAEHRLIEAQRAVVERYALQQLMPTHSGAEKIVELQDAVMRAAMTYRLTLDAARNGTLESRPDWQALKSEALEAATQHGAPKQFITGALAQHTSDKTRWTSSGEEIMARLAERARPSRDSESTSLETPPSASELRAALKRDLGLDDEILRVIGVPTTVLNCALDVAVQRMQMTRPWLDQVAPEKVLEILTLQSKLEQAVRAAPTDLQSLEVGEQQALLKTIGEQEKELRALVEASLQTSSGTPRPPRSIAESQEALREVQDGLDSESSSADTDYIRSVLTAHLDELDRVAGYQDTFEHTFDRLTSGMKHRIVDEHQVTRDDATAQGLLLKAVIALPLAFFPVTLPIAATVLGSGYLDTGAHVLTRGRQRSHEHSQIEEAVELLRDGQVQRGVGKLQGLTDALPTTTGVVTETAVTLGLSALPLVASSVGPRLANLVPTALSTSASSIYRYLPDRKLATSLVGLGAQLGPWRTSPIAKGISHAALVSNAFNYPGLDTALQLALPMARDAHVLGPDALRNMGLGTRAAIAVSAAWKASSNPISPEFADAVFTLVTSLPPAVDNKKFQKLAAAYNLARATQDPMKIFEALRNTARALDVAEVAGGLNVQILLDMGEMTAKHVVQVTERERERALVLAELQKKLKKSESSESSPTMHSPREPTYADTWDNIRRLVLMARGQEPEQVRDLTGDMAAVFKPLSTTDNVDYYRQFNEQIKEFVKLKHAQGDTSYEVPDYLLRYGDANIRNFHEHMESFSPTQQASVAQIQHGLQERLEWLKHDPELLDFCLRHPSAFNSYAFQTHEVYCEALAVLPMGERLGIALTPKLGDTLFNPKAWPTILEVGAYSLVRDADRASAREAEEHGMTRSQYLAHSAVHDL